MTNERKRMALLEWAVGRAERKLERAEEAVRTVEERAEWSSNAARQLRERMEERERARAEYQRARATLQAARGGAGAAHVERPAPSANGTVVSINRAGLDSLRRAGMSRTQAARVLRYRDDHGGFSSVDQLDELPGFPRDQLAVIKRRLVP